MSLNISPDECIAIGAAVQVPFPVHLTSYIVHRTSYIVHRTSYTVHCTLKQSVWLKQDLADFYFNVILLLDLKYGSMFDLTLTSYLTQ